MLSRVTTLCTPIIVFCVHELVLRAHGLLCRVHELVIHAHEVVICVHRLVIILAWPFRISLHRILLSLPHLLRGKSRIMSPLCHTRFFNMTGMPIGRQNYILREVCVKRAMLEERSHKMAEGEDYVHISI